MCGTTVSVSHTKYIIRHRLLFFASWYIYFVIISETTTFHVIKLLHLYPPTFKWHHDLPIYWVWYLSHTSVVWKQNQHYSQKPQCANLVIIIMVKDTRKGIIGVGKAKLCFCISRNCWLPIIISFVWTERSRKDLEWMTYVHNFSRNQGPTFIPSDL